MYTLDKKIFTKLFLSVSEASPEDQCPADMSPEKAILMKRCMEAHCMEDIADIPTDVILDLFQYIDQFGKFLASQAVIGENGDLSKLLQSMPSVKRRRIY